MPKEKPVLIRTHTMSSNTEKCPRCGKDKWEYRDFCNECSSAADAKALKEALATLPPNLKTIVATYSGSGDSGEFEEVVGYERTALDDGDDEPLFSDFYGGVEIVGEKAVEDCLDAMLTRAFTGWEIDDGARGTFVIDLVTQKVYHEHISYYISEEVETNVTSL
jgi:hypothetical protein